MHSARLWYFPSRHIVVAALLALMLLPRFAWASDNLEKQLRSDYLDKMLTLRHFYSGEHLKFRSDGTLNGYASTGPWTLDDKSKSRKFTCAARN